MSLMLILVYMFGVHVTQVVNEFIIDNPDISSRSMMTEYFGSLWKSMYTLFQTISNGISWREVNKVLLDIHWSYSIWTSVFVSFSVFAVLNVVTGIFVNTAMQVSQEDQDIVIADEMSQEKSYAAHILKIFNEADVNHDGFVDAKEFERHLEDRRVKTYLGHLGLSPDEARGLFRLLDIGNTGRVDSREFVLGCMRLKGPAGRIDMATLMYENKRNYEHMLNKLAQFMQYVQNEFTRLSPESLVAFASMTIQPADPQPANFSPRANSDEAILIEITC
jgi:hypothetical protein